MTDTTQSEHVRQPRSAPYGWFRARRRRLLAIVVILAAIVGAFAVGLQMARRDLADAKQLVQQTQTESQRLKNQIAEQDSELAGLRSTLAKVQTTLNEIMPEKDTYQIPSNQSVIVADGRVTIGLVGSPSNEGINININGKQQLVAPGDIIDVKPNCHVRVQSFDMFKAIVTVMCSATQ